MSYQIVQASFDEIKLAVFWAKQEGWNPGENDAFCYQLIDSNGFFIGLLDGEPIACISNVKYAHDFYFLGFYIVQAAHRGQGYGIKIWQHALRYSGQANVGLDGVIAQQNNYQRSGFHFAMKNVRYSCQANHFSNRLHAALLPVADLPLELILAYDAKIFVFQRRAFLSAWLFMPNAYALAFYDHGVRGYGVIRQCADGYKIGPLFADDSEIAAALFMGLCAQVAKGSAIYIDITAANTFALMLVKQFNLQAVFETARMYRSNAPAFDHNKMFGLTGFEVG